MDEGQCREVLVELGSAFPKSKPLGTIDDQVKLWMRHFRGVSIDDMILTVADWTSTQSFFPTIKEWQKHLKVIAEVESSDAICQCDGIGYYEVAARQWVPCPACLPATNQRWAGGHFAPGHWCEECSKTARGEGAIQRVDERGLVARPSGRKLTKEENLERLAAVRKIVGEIDDARKADPHRHQRLTRGEIDRHWENRFNEIIQGDSDVDPAVIQLFNEEAHFVEIPDTGPGVAAPPLVMDVREPSDHGTDDEGFEIL